MIGIITVTGTTYAIFTTTTMQEGTNTIETLKCLELEFSNQKNVISLLNTYPMTDERGSKNTPYTFTLTNKCGTYVEYSIGLAINKDNTLEDKYVKTVFSLASDTGEPVLLTNRQKGGLYNNKETYIFRYDGLENNASKDYKLVLWVDGTASDSEMQKSFLGNIIINTKPIKNEGQKTITVDLDGGNLLQELNEIYREGMQIKLPIPAKAGYHFDRWEVTKGDATIDENNYLTIGKENISLKAYYQGGLTLTLELNGGSTTQTIKGGYGGGEKVTLIEPTKEEYKFGGWKIISGDGTLDGNILTINTESVVLEATWLKALALTVDLNGGSTTQIFADNYYENDELELTAPTKTNSVFAGWEVITGDIVITDNKFTFGKTNVSIKVLWQESWDFTFANSSQELSIPYSGYYKAELWGASGGNATYNNVTRTGGNGAYTSGIIYLEKNEKIYVYTGENYNGLRESLCFNGGGRGQKQTSSNGVNANGGGATDIRLISGDWNDDNSLNSRIMVASGGGGALNIATNYWVNDGGGGGTLIGISGTVLKKGSVDIPAATGGTQISGGNANGIVMGMFGIGGYNATYTVGYGYSPGGGGGYYGGSSGYADSGVTASAAGGSSFISGYAGVNAITSASDRTHTNNTLHYSGKYFINGSMTASANSGNGKAKITFISKNSPTRNTNFNNVRYVKNCIKGNSITVWNHWVEFQVIKDGLNLALGKTPSGVKAIDTNRPLSWMTDGDITLENYVDIDYDASVTTAKEACATIDIGSVQDIDEIAIWHFWNKDRVYYNQSIYVSSDNTNWTALINNRSDLKESVNGIRINAYE